MEMNKVDKFWGATTVPYDDFKNIQESLNFERMRTSLYPKYIELMDYNKNHDSEIILDYGCGVGNDLIRFNIVSKPKKIIGIDISEKALNQAMKRIKLHGFNNIKLIKIKSDNICKFPIIQDNTIDYIHSGGVLHHTTNIGTRLSEFSRILKDSGCGNIMVYNRNSLWFHLYLSYYLIDKNKTYNGSPDKYFKQTTDGGECPVSMCFKPEDFIKLCNDYGLKCEYNGGYLSEMEMNFHKDYYEEAIKSETLNKESSDFLKNITYDNNGLILYDGKYAGIGGSYRISKMKNFVPLNVVSEQKLKSLAIEITNKCNLKCKMCIKYTDYYNEYKKTAPQKIDFKLFKKIVKEYSEMDFPNNEKSIILQFQGESLMVKNFIDYCNYVNDNQISFGFTTNGTLLNKKIVDKLFELDYFRTITFSIDAFSKDLFESIRINAKRDVVYNNIEYILEKNQKLSDEKKIGININCVILPENESEIEYIVKYFFDKGITNVNASYVTDKDIIPKRKNYDCERILCHSLFDSMIILTSGNVVACCRDSKYELNLGNVSNETLSYIWNGNNYKELRQIHIDRRWMEINPCDNCLTWACRVAPKREESNIDGVYKDVGCFWFTWGRKVNESK